VVGKGWVWGEAGLEAMMLPDSCCWQKHQGVNIFHREWVLKGMCLQEGHLKPMVASQKLRLLVIY